MHTLDDWNLIQDYRKTRSEAAFAELVHRHIDWVHSVALRQVGNSQLAEEVVQAVFILLARKAASLRSGTLLGGWLFRTTCFVSRCSLRAEQRRKNREHTASTFMTDLQTDETELLWQKLIPYLDQAVATLSEADRLAVLLRFYEKKSLSQVGQQLGISEDAAKKRVSRTVEKLRDFLVRRGVSLGAVTLGTLLVENAVQAAPAALTSGVIKSSVAGTMAAPIGLVRETLNAWRWAKIKLASAAGLSAALLGLLLHTVSGGVANYGINPPSQNNEPPVSSQLSSGAAGETATASRTNAQAVPAGPRFLFRVESAESGKGIGGAQILVSRVVGSDWAEERDLVTDEKGVCTIPLPEGRLGRLDVGALKDGFVEKFYTWRVDYGTPLPPCYILKLERAVTIGGHVQDRDGNPISNAEIGLIFHGTSDSSSSEPQIERLGFIGDPVPAAKTDTEGNWHCALTPPGHTGFNIGVRHPRHVRREFMVGSKASENNGQVAMEDLLNQKAIMTLAPGFELKGFVLDESGNPIAGAKAAWIGNLNSPSDEIKTGSDGSFRMTMLPQGTVQISASATAFAPSVMSVEVTSNNRDVLFRLSRGAELPIRITDQDGSGIPDAWAVLELPISHNGDFRVSTDAAGYAKFEGIPTNALKGLLLHAGANGYFYARNFTVGANVAQPIIRLTKSLHVTGNVLDAETRQPIVQFKAIPCRGEDSSGYDRSETSHGQSGWYSMGFTEPGMPYRVRIEAEGYEPAMSPPMGSQPAEQSQDFLLRRADSKAAIHGVVLLPDGNPAAKIRVCLLTFEQGAALQYGELKPNPGSMPSILTNTDEHGEFTFAAAPQAHTLIASDPAIGFGLLRMHGAGPLYTIQLSPWGRIEGTLQLSGNAAPNRQVSLQRGWPAYRSVQDGLYAADSATTDASGHFTFEQVPPGGVTLYLSEGIGKSLSHQTALEVHAGVTTQVEMGSGGRLITGTLVISDGSKADWRTQVILASLVTNAKRPSIQLPPAKDFAGKLNLLDFFDQSTEWRAFERGSGSFPLQIAADGSFTVENIRPGPYKLSVSISESPYDPGNPRIGMQRFGRRTSASLVTEVVVPGELDDLTPLDLGTFTLIPSLSAHK